MTWRPCGGLEVPSAQTLRRPLASGAQRSTQSHQPIERVVVGADRANDNRSAAGGHSSLPMTDAPWVESGLLGPLDQEESVRAGKPAGESARSRRS